jgi:hypothetical protein
VVHSWRSRLRLERGENPRGKVGWASGLDEPDELVQVDPAIGKFSREPLLEARVQEPLATPRGDRLRRPFPILELKRHVHLATPGMRFLPCL